MADGTHSLVVEDTNSHEVSTINAQWVINCAGLHAHQVAKCFEQMPKASIPQVWYAKGNYFSLSGRSPFSRLIYPIPEEGGLGSHLTLDWSDPHQCKFGPDVEWLDVENPSSISYDVNPGRLANMMASIRSYWPQVPVDALVPSYSGVRGKLSGPGMPAEDFQIQTPETHGIPGLVHLYGIESPGLTSSLALGALVCSVVERSR